MAIVEWTKSLEVGIPEIDFQHRNLVSMLNALHTAIEAGETRQNLSDILEELDLYVVNHFATEERLMERLRYEFIAQHKAEHLRLAETVQQHRAAFARGDGSAEELMQFLIRWLLNHIAGADSHIGTIYNQQNSLTKTAGH